MDSWFGAPGGAEPPEPCLQACEYSVGSPLQRSNRGTRRLILPLFRQRQPPVKETSTAAGEPLLAGNLDVAIALLLLMKALRDLESCGSSKAEVEELQGMLTRASRTLDSRIHPPALLADTRFAGQGSRRRLTPSRPFGLRSGSLASDRKCAGPNRCLGLKGCLS